MRTLSERGGDAGRGADRHRLGGQDGADLGGGQRPGAGPARRPCGPVRSVAVTPDGSRIVTGSEDNTARIWDAASGRELAQLTGHEGGVRSVAVTPDGSRIVTGSEDSTVRIWDAASGRELAQLTGHDGRCHKRGGDAGRVAHRHRLCG